MEQRTTLALILSFVVIMLYQVYLSVFFPPEEEPPAQTTETPATTATPTGSTQPTLAQAPTTSAAVPVTQSAVPVAAIKKELGQNVTAANNLVTTRVNTQGGRLVGLDFLKYKDQLGSEGKPVRFLQETPEHLFFGESGFISLPGVSVPTRDTLWQVADFQGNPGETGVRLVWDNGHGLTFEKSFILAKDSYLVTVQDRVINATPQPVPLYRFQQMVRVAPKADEQMYDFQGPTAFLDDTRHQLPYEEIQAKEISHQARKGWAGYSDKYFLAALIPAGDGQKMSKFYFDYDAPTHRIGAVSHQQAAPAQSTLESRDHWYIGPKELHTLEAMHLELERAIDYGWFHFLAVPLMEMLLFFNNFVGNFGVAIVLLTVVVKLIFYPLADKSYRSMDAMKQLQPKVEQIRQTYGHDKQLLNQEIMRLYQEHKVNPLGGCLPMLIQIPVFFALYKVLYLSIEMRQAPLGGWVHDLSEMDPYYILPILMGISMYYQTKLNPSPADPMQAKIMNLLPLIFTAMFFTFPSGLVLYWLVNNILSIAQQLMITRKNKPKV